MDILDTQIAVADAVAPLRVLSRRGFQTTICGGPPADKPVGDRLTDAAIELLDLATQKPGIFIAYDAPTGLELFRAGLLMIYVTGGEAYYEPTAIAKREGQAIVAEHRRRVARLRDELRAHWKDYVDAEDSGRRDLVPYDQVLREFGPEVADREARPPRGIA